MMTIARVTIIMIMADKKNTNIIHTAKPRRAKRITIVKETYTKHQEGRRGETSVFDHSNTSNFAIYYVAFGKVIRVCRVLCC